MKKTRREKYRINPFATLDQKEAEALKVALWCPFRPPADPETEATLRELRVSLASHLEILRLV